MQQYVCRRTASAVLGLCCVSLVSPARAQIVEGISAIASIAGPALMKKSVKGILSDAQLTASTLINEGRMAGNGLLIRGADELNVSIINANNIFADRLDKTLEQIEGPERKLLEGIAGAQISAAKLVDRAYTAKDTIALDVAGILGSLPFVEERFTIQRVGGLTQLEKGGAYQMRVIGSYVGTVGTGPRTSLKLKIDGQDVPNLGLNPEEAHITGLTIPNAVLKPHFKSASIAVVDAELVAEFTTPTTFLFFFSSEKKQTVVNKLHLLLYPAYAGEANVVVSTPTFGWKAISADSKNDTGPDAHCSSNCRGVPGIPWEFSLTVPGGEHIPQVPNDIRIVGATCDQIPPGNAFDFGKNVVVADSGRRATCHITAHTHRQSYQLSVTREQWLPITDVVNTTIIKMYYNDISQVSIPLEKSNIKIEGKSLAGDSFMQFIEVVDPGSPIEVVKRDLNANDATLYLRARRPSTLD